MQCRRYLTFLMIITMAGALCQASGCTRKPKQEELTKLDEARMAAEAAERKLAELRSERQMLERALEQKQAELKKQEQERDELKAKLGK